MVRQSRQRHVLGDLLWVRIRSHLWWPAQVVDAKCVSNDAKPKKRSASEILVRLYGSYRYMFVDPAKYHSEFDRILKQNNGNYREIFLKYLEQVNCQDISRMEPGSQKKRASESREESMEERFEEEAPREDVAVKKQKPDSPEPVPPL